jgi:hypothetical protein
VSRKSGVEGKMPDIKPFAFHTPEDLTAETVKSLFVDVFSDFTAVEKPGHTFLHGPRGSGKSMMFRYLEPDCQRLVTSRPLHEQEFFGVLVPIKKTDLNLVEMARLSDSHAVVLNEHLLTTTVATRTFSALRKAEVPDTRENRGALAEFAQTTFRRLLKRADWDGGQLLATPKQSVSQIVKELEETCDEMTARGLSYIRRLAFPAAPPPYTGPLAAYLELMVPLIRELRQLPFMPQGPIYLLVDDADNLSHVQTQVLNTWVSYRTIGDISLKISTQLAYKTFQTISGRTIDRPHDYSEVHISAVYTGSGRSKYKERIHEIVRRRLDAAKLDMTDPEEFFPADIEQEQKIQKIAAELREKHARGEGRGYRASDDATRYARPDYIKSLRGPSKSAPSYSYAGFDQLVHVSDGVIRHFLEAADKMWSETQALNPGVTVEMIPHTIQNRVVRDMASQLMADFEQKIRLDEDPDDIRKLKNVIRALGGLFQQIMLSDASERRAFSIAFQDEPETEVERILDIGVRHGYLQRKTIGNKDGTGKTLQYILSRRLAPEWTLDPTSFAGYKFVTNARIREAMYRPQAFLREVKAHGVDAVMVPQTDLFALD